MKPNDRFSKYKELFSHLTKSKNLPTKYPIVSCIITYNSKLAITVSKKDDQEMFIKMYNLDTYEMTFEESVGGKPE